MWMYIAYIQQKWRLQLITFSDPFYVLIRRRYKETVIDRIWYYSNFIGWDVKKIKDV
tara:strand:+ start:2118 stop:2288 length:171 start_codon:yes stop_codon:yes gene_type:complete